MEGIGPEKTGYFLVNTVEEDMIWSTEIGLWDISDSEFAILQYFRKAEAWSAYLLSMSSFVNHLAYDLT